jgi:threonine/homoserine/homoserine lactone efflux protein
MPELSQFALFLAAATLLAITPGPGIFYVAARTLAAGRAEGIASSLGTGLGGLVHVLAGAAGISALLMASATAFIVLKWIGAAYLILLGVRTIRQARASLAAPVESLQSESFQVGEMKNGAQRAFREGIAVEALNPKTAIFFLAFIPQFITPEAGVPGLQFIMLGLISVSLNTLADLIVALGADRIRRVAIGQAQRMSQLQQASGGAMIALGAGLLMTQGPVVD